MFDPAKRGGLDGIVVAALESPGCRPSQRLEIPRTMNSPSEAIVRNALRNHVLEDTFGALVFVLLGAHCVVLAMWIVLGDLY
jgi:hypothetical protein